ncbi:MAG: tyrosine-type recombinase/integrase, partial [Acidaminococcaceae bacterium]|nr:tyrosine-type recombinase/integrase [Acidaminococcaceae bacterium]
LGIDTYAVNWPIGCGKEFDGVYDREKSRILCFAGEGKGNKASTIYANLISLKKFYHVAQKFHFIQDNPVADVKSPRDPDAAIIKFPYLNAGKLEYLLHIVPTDSEKTLRDKVMIVFMALEGLRTVEIHRMNEGDINFGQQSIFIHGKGKNGIIYPRRDTFNLLLHYLQVKDRSVVRPDENGEIPVFTSTSRNQPGNRIDRRNIRLAIDGWLKKAGLKEPHKSAHMLRHTCATLLYKETKDLKVVQETLRHSTINMSGKYAHLMEREENRYTKNIPIDLNE